MVAPPVDGLTGTAAIAQACEVLLPQLMVVVAEPVSVLPPYLMNPDPEIAFHRCVWLPSTVSVPL